MTDQIAVVLYSHNCVPIIPWYRRIYRILETLYYMYLQMLIASRTAWAWSQAPMDRTRATSTISSWFPVTTFTKRVNSNISNHSKTRNLIETMITNRTTTIYFKTTCNGVTRLRTMQLSHLRIISWILRPSIIVPSEIRRNKRVTRACIRNKTRRIKVKINWRGDWASRVPQEGSSTGDSGILRLVRSH